MAIPVKCESCGVRFKAPESAAGKKGKCSKCGATLVVPVPAAVAVPPEDDLYDLADAPAPAATAPARTQVASQPAAPSPRYDPSPAPASSASATMMSRGVVPKSPNAGAWKSSNNPPKIMKILSFIGGVVLIILGLIIAAVPILALMRDEPGTRIRFKGVFIGIALIVTGIAAIAKAFKKAEE